MDRYRVVAWGAASGDAGRGTRGALVASASLASLSAVVILRLVGLVSPPVLAVAVLAGSAGALAGLVGVRRERRAPAAAADVLVAAVPDDERIVLVDIDRGGATEVGAPVGPAASTAGPSAAAPVGAGDGPARSPRQPVVGADGGDDLSPAVRRLAGLVGRPDDAVVVLGPDGRIRATGPACDQLWGVPTGRWVGRSFAGTLVAADMAAFQRFLADVLTAPAGTVASFVARATHAGGAVRRLELRAVADGAGAVVTAREVGERRMGAPAAAQDPLTGLLTSTELQARCAAALERRRGTPHPAVALLVLDLDDVPAIGAALGTLAADDLLVSVATRLRECLRSGDVAARLDDDRFVVLIEGRGAAHAGAVADRVLDLVHLPLRAGEVDVALAGSVGLAVGRPTSTSRSLLREAAAAARSAQDAGGGRVHRFDPPA